MSYTKGPWTSELSRGRSNVRSGLVLAKEGKTIVAEVNMEIESWGDGNLRLITAAPEMYAILEELLATVDAPTWHPRWNCARKIIKKVKGEI